MKKMNFVKKLLSGATVLALVATFSSCKKDDVDDQGTAHVKVVNASTSSTAQSFYLANTPVLSSGLTFGNASDYTMTNSGNRLTAQFRNEGTSTVYASDNFDFDRGSYYTVFVAGDGQSARVKMYKDDLTAVDGKARVRFVHLSDAAPENVTIKRANGTVLVSNLGRDKATDFTTIDAGILAIQVSAVGDDTTVSDFDLSTFAAGKIYTVYIAGSTQNNISVRKITHN